MAGETAPGNDLLIVGPGAHPEGLPAASALFFTAGPLPPTSEASADSSTNTLRRCLSIGGPGEQGFLLS